MRHDQSYEKTRSGREGFQSIRNSFLGYNMMDLRPSISSSPFCTKPFKSAGAFANHLKKIHSGQSLPVKLPVKRKRATSSNKKSSETDSLKENDIHEGNDFVLSSPFSDYSELGLILPCLEDSQPSISACLFCNWAFKSPGAFASYLEKRHSGQSLPIKQTRATSSNDYKLETASLKENSSEVNTVEPLYQHNVRTGTQHTNGGFMHLEGFCVQ